MKRTLRFTLLSVLVSLTLLTIAAVGISGFWNTYRTANDLTEQLLEQTAARVDRRIVELVQIGERQVAIYKHRFRNGLLSPNDPSPLGAYWFEIVEAIPIVNGMFYARESDGRTLAVIEPPDGRPTTIREYIPEPGGLRMWTYSAAANLQKSQFPWEVSICQILGQLASPAGGLPAARTPPAADITSRLLHYDMRQQLGYQMAKKGGQAAWSETYFFLDDHGVPSYPGVSHVTPLYGPGGKLEGVLGVNFNL